MSIDFSNSNLELPGNDLETTYYWIAIAFETANGDSDVASWAYTPENGELGIEGFSFKQTPDAPVWFRGFFGTEVVYNFDIDCLPMTISSTMSSSKLEGVRIAPNPSSDQISITGIKSFDNITVYNLLGQEQLALNPDGPLDVGIDLSSWQNGVYVVLIRRGGKVGTYKITKQ
ncbi:MAG: T9SS type A sorting domain-containing protein [Bacteroidota bacterium]